MMMVHHLYVCTPTETPLLPAVNHFLKIIYFIILHVISYLLYDVWNNICPSLNLKRREAIRARVGSVCFANYVIGPLSSRLLLLSFRILSNIECTRCLLSSSLAQTRPLLYIK